MLYRFWKLPVDRDTRGHLCPIEFTDLPFVPRRTYFLFDVKGLRGGHAHRQEKEVFVCIKGTFRARIHDGKRFRTFFLKQPGQALYTTNLVWHEFDQFSPGAILLALSSTRYNGKKGYIMNFQKFLSLCRKKSS